ncbi:MAG: RNA polymerase factor sigma-54 [Deltaproteobacteria bacterium]
MALEQRLTLKLTHQLRMTPQLRLAIKILQVSRADLEEMVAEEVEQNPLLEEAPNDTAAESRTADLETVEAEADQSKPKESDKEAKDLRSVDWEEYIERYSGDFHGSIGVGSDRDDNRTDIIENTAVAADALTATLLDQLGLLMMSEEERSIGTIIIHNLDEDGYIDSSPDELAFMAECSVEKLNEVREMIHEFEPPGVAASDLRECLLVQLKLEGYETDDYVVMLVDGHLGDLESERYEKIAKTLDTTATEVAECHRIIKGLEPKPGRNYGVGQTRYITPDLYIHRVGDEFQVTLNDDGLPNLHVSPYYQGILAKQGKGETRGYLQDKARSAQWLIRSIEQRKRTLRKVAESIIGFQKDFLDNGVENLRPMVLKDVAQDIDMHESTVSRATANKYAHTPQGLLELKYFFTSGLRGANGEEVSSEAVKKKIRELVEAEDAARPHSDQHLAKLLSEQNIDIARRTVAKYRELLAIPPSSKRRRNAARG